VEAVEELVAELVAELALQPAHTSAAAADKSMGLQATSTRTSSSSLLGWLPRLF